jgi:hypothetical protein
VRAVLLDRSRRDDHDRIALEGIEQLVTKHFLPVNGLSQLLPHPQSEHSPVNRHRSALPNVSL